MNLFWRLMRILLMIVVLSPILNLRTYADVNVWETLLEPTVYVKDLICDPDIPNRMYGITEYKVDNGHIYYVPSISENEGRTWQLSFDGIGIDPSPDNWSSCRLIATPTGEFKLYMIISDRFNQFARIYESIDRGISWFPYSDIDAQVYALTISRTQSNIWIGGGILPDHSGAMLRSTDTGKTWSIIDYGGNGHVNDIEFSRTNPDILVACVKDTEKHLVRSNDMGLTWTILPTGNWGWNSSKDVSIHPTDPDMIVATIQGPPRWSHFMCRSTDGGETWSVFGPEETDFYGVGGAMSVHFDSRDPSIIYVHKIDGDVLWRSTNGGVDWELTVQDVAGGQNTLSRFVESPWNENTVYINIAGVFASRDRGHTWIPTGQTTSSVFYVHPTDSNYLYSASYCQSFFRSTDRGKTWGSSSTGIPFFSMLAKNDTICASRFNPQTLWMSCQRSESSKDGYLAVIVRSDDYGASWSVLPDVPGDSIYRFYASRHVPDRLFAIVYDVIDNKWENFRLAISDDGGETWRESVIPGVRELSCFTETNQYPSIWIAVGNDETDQRVRFFRSNDAGATWMCKGPESGLDSTYIYYSEVVTDPFDDMKLYLTSPYYWYSDDLGDTWTKWSDPPSAGKVYLDPNNPSIMYCGGYRSTDHGKTWADEDGFYWIQFDSADSNLLYQLDPNQRPVLIKKMTIASEKPTLYMAGFGPTFLNIGYPSLFQIYAYAKDSDPNDLVTSIELFYNGEPIGDRLSEELAPGLGLFYKLYDITPSASGTFNLQLRAKDRFGLLSNPWPEIIVKEGDKK